MNCLKTSIFLSLLCTVISNVRTANTKEKGNGQHHQQQQQQIEIGDNISPYYFADNNCWFDGRNFRFDVEEIGQVICSEKTCPRNSTNPQYAGICCHKCCYSREIFHVSVPTSTKRPEQTRQLQILLSSTHTKTTKKKRKNTFKPPSKGIEKEEHLWYMEKSTFTALIAAFSVIIVTLVAACAFLSYCYYNLKQKVKKLERQLQHQNYKEMELHNIKGKKAEEDADSGVVDINGEDIGGGGIEEGDSGPGDEERKPLLKDDAAKTENQSSEENANTTQVENDAYVAETSSALQDIPVLTMKIVSASIIVDEPQEREVVSPEEVPSIIPVVT